MLQPSRTPRTDIAVAVGMIVISGIVWLETRKVAPAFFDPLGSAAMPRIAATLTTGLAILVLIRAVTGLRIAEADGGEGYRRRPDLAVAILLLTVAYAGSMDWGLLGFKWATVAFVFLSGAVLGGFKRRTLATSAVIAIVLGFGGTYLFRDIFYIDLPFQP